MGTKISDMTPSEPLVGDEEIELSIPGSNPETRKTTAQEIADLSDLQTITLTGDVTGSGTGTFAATIANDAVTYAKLQNVSATDRLLGRSTAGAGNAEEITCTAAGRALIDDADASAQRTTLGLGTLATQNGTFSGTSSGTNTGDETGARVATLLHAASAKSALVDADEVNGTDSAASFSLIRSTWTNVKAFLKTYFDTLYMPAAGAITGITDLTTTGNTILGDASTDTLNVGNGGIVKDASGNTGFGGTSGGSAVEVFTGSRTGNGFNIRFNAANSPMGFGVAASNGFCYLGNNTKQVSGTDNQTYDIASSATRLRTDSGQFVFNYAASGSAGAAITWSEAMRIDASGNVGIGTASPTAGSKLTVAGDTQIKGAHVEVCDANGTNPWYITRDNIATGNFQILGAGPVVAWEIDTSFNIIPRLTATPPTLTVNGQMVFNLTSNTNLRISVRGTDGTTRVANITLA